MTGESGRARKCCHRTSEELDLSNSDQHSMHNKDCGRKTNIRNTLPWVHSVYIKGRKHLSCTVRQEQSWLLVTLRPVDTAPASEKHSWKPRMHSPPSCCFQNISNVGSPLPWPLLLSLLCWLHLFNKSSWSSRTQGSFFFYPFLFAICTHCSDGDPICPHSFNYHLYIYILQLYTINSGFSPEFQTYTSHISNSTCLKFNCCSYPNLSPIAYRMSWSVMLATIIKATSSQTTCNLVLYFIAKGSLQQAWHHSLPQELVSNSLIQLSLIPSWGTQNSLSSHYTFHEGRAHSWRGILAMHTCSFWNIF